MTHYRKIPFVVAFSFIISSMAIGASLPNFSTPIRVLLETTPGPVTFRIPQGGLVASTDGEQWNELKQTLILSARTGFTPRTLILKNGSSTETGVDYQGRTYRGIIKVNVQDQRIQVINILSLEDYISGILAGEMNASWELSALKAQAIAARTYALFMKRNPRHLEYDLASGTQDQVYLGASAETPKTNQAVRETRGVYLSHNGKPIKAYFHSRCGGMTETADKVWNRHKPSHARVICPYCQRHPFTWEARISLFDFFRILEIPFTKAFQLFSERSPSGRVAELRVLANDKKLAFSSEQLRQRFGYTRIKSTRFNWQVNGGEVKIEGIGAGHGVGMCQWGARYLAQVGKGHIQILKYYYPDSTLAILLHPNRS